MRKVDVAIVGGGPAGLASAIEAARRGLSVIVIERQGPHPDKACGEGLMPSGWRALEALGAATFLQAEDCATFSGIRYLQEDGATLTARFRRGNGTGVRRLALVSALLEAARKHGAEVLHHTVARSVHLSAEGAALIAGEEQIMSRLLIAADGLASPLRKQAGLDGSSARTRRFGIRQHFRNVPTSGYVDVHWGPGAEAYITPIGEWRCGIAFLFDANSVAQPSFDALLARFPEVQRQLVGASADSEPRGAGPLLRRVKRCVQGRLVLVGDAAGYVDAITGEGLSLAFASAMALGAVLPDAVARPSDPQPLLSYERAHADIFREYETLASRLVWLSSHPSLRKTAFRLGKRWPSLFERAVNRAAESH